MNGYTYALIASLLIPAAALAESKTEGELRIAPILKLNQDKSFNDSQMPLAGKLVLVTIRIHDKMFLHTELTIQRQADWFKSVKLPAGECEVTFQAEGMRMIIKRGILVTPGAWTMVNADLVAGSGLTVTDESPASDGDVQVLGSERFARLKTQR